MDSKHDRIGLLIITGGIVLALTLIARWAVQNEIKSDAGILLGTIATGMIAFGKDLVTAIRGYSMSAQLSKVTDQLASSVPTNDNEKTKVPKDAAEGARAAADSADETATDMEKRA